MINIQRFGGRGASSSASNKIAPTTTNIHNKSVDNMIKKYGNIIEDIYKDAEAFEYGGGYWVTLREGYISPDMDARTIHEGSVSEVLKLLRNVKKNK